MLSNFLTNLHLLCLTLFLVNARFFPNVESLFVGEIETSLLVSEFDTYSAGFASTMITAMTKAAEVFSARDTEMSSKVIIATDAVRVDPLKLSVMIAAGAAGTATS